MLPTFYFFFDVGPAILFCQDLNFDGNKEYYSNSTSKETLFVVLPKQSAENDLISKTSFKLDLYISDLKYHRPTDLIKSKTENEKKFSSVY